MSPTAEGRAGAEDQHRQAVEGLFTLLEEFFEYLAGPDDATSQTL